MSTRGIADVVFCLDASGSMEPCFDGVRRHVVDFIEGLKSEGQISWDLRFDFVAQHCGQSPDDLRVFDTASIHHDRLWDALYARSLFSSEEFFSSDVGEFRKALSKVEVKGNESSLIALDFALDFPWREASACHRVVIQMTDEPFETGAGREDAEKIPQLIDKIQQLRVMLYLVTPESDVFSRLAEVDRCEHWVVDKRGMGLADVDFGEVLGYIGKSVSASTLQGESSSKVRRGLFNQPSWGSDTATFSE